MSIICPNCRTNFIVPKEQIGIAGRKVKCSQCLHIWHLKLDFADKQSEHDNRASNSAKENIVINEKIADIKKAQNLPYLDRPGTNLPILVPIKTNSSNITPILAFSLIILLLLIIFPQELDLSSFLPKQNNRITLDYIHIKQNKDERKIKLSYKITNNSNHDVTIPLIRVELLNKNHQAVKSYLMNQKNTKLLPKQQIEITTNLDVVPDSSELLNIMLGNNLDFILQ